MTVMVDILDCKPYSKEDTAYREFKFKMSKIKDRMLTPEGKRLAEERHVFMEVFFERLERETKGAESVAEDFLKIGSARDVYCF